MCFYYSTCSGLWDLPIDHPWWQKHGWVVEVDHNQSRGLEGNDDKKRKPQTDDRRDEEMVR